MHRRDFLLKSAAAAAAAQTMSPLGLFAQAPAAPKPKKNVFKLKYAPHFGMFKARPARI